MTECKRSILELQVNMVRGSSIYKKKSLQVVEQFQNRYCQWKTEYLIIFSKLIICCAKKESYVNVTLMYQS